MNFRGALAIFNNELMRAFRTVFGSILSPVLTTSLYLVVFLLQPAHKRRFLLTSSAQFAAAMGGTRTSRMEA